jgi:hypothetical protein
MKGKLRIIEVVEKSKKKETTKTHEYDVETDGTDVLVNVDGWVFRIPYVDDTWGVDRVLQTIMPQGACSLLVGDKELLINSWSDYAYAFRLLVWLQSVPA